MYSALSACKHRVSGSLSLPSRGSFHLSLTVLITIGHRGVFSLGGWSLRLPTRFLVSGCTLDPTVSLDISFTGLSPSLVMFPNMFYYILWITSVVLNPIGISTNGLGSFAFARRYLQNRFFFLLLWVLRCFSSPRLPPYTLCIHV